MTTDRSDPAGRTGETPGDAVAAALRARAAETKADELAEGLRRLDADGLTPEQRAVVGEMADAIVEGLLGGPDERLRAADDDAVARDAAVLFDLDGVAATDDTARRAGPAAGPGPDVGTGTEVPGDD